MLICTLPGACLNIVYCYTVPITRASNSGIPNPGHFYNPEIPGLLTLKSRAFRDYKKFFMGAAKLIKI